jgi:hypothetical protein
MKTKSLILTICLPLFFFSCESGETPSETTDVPTCLSDLTTQQNPPLEIWSYQYNGQLVYLTKPDCCDQYEQLYSSACSLLCAPGGGFSGKGDGKCPDFYDKATNGKLVWKAK